MVEIRLRDISDQIVQLRIFLGEEPNNQTLISLLEAERRQLLRQYIKVIDGT